MRTSVFVLLIVGLAVLSITAIVALEAPASDDLSYEGAIEFAMLIDKYADEVVRQMPSMPHDKEALSVLTLEVVPYFVYEEISVTEIYPNEITWLKVESPRHFHTLGRAACRESPLLVGINIRFALPIDPLFQNHPLLISTVVHELAHINGLCDSHEDMESAAQMAALEVLAAMSNHRNAYAFPAFLRELKSFAVSYAYSQALKEGRMDEFNHAIAQMADSNFNVASSAKSQRHWETRQEELRLILSRYGEVPYVMLVEALQNPDYITREVSSFPNLSHTIAMDDTAYIILHIQELVEDYGKIVE